MRLTTRVAISNVQISLIFPGLELLVCTNVRVSGDSVRRALSNGVCNAIYDCSITKPRPLEVSPYKLNTKTNEAGGCSAEPISTIQTSNETLFHEPPSGICSTPVPQTKALVLPIL